MKVLFQNPGMDYMVNSIMMFQKEDESSFWSEPLYHFYPQLDKAYVFKLSPKEKSEYIRDTLISVYRDQESTINHKVDIYSTYWDKCEPQITEALSDAFSLDCKGLFNDMKCFVSMNPISPRFLSDNNFEVFYLNSERGAVGTSIHEIIHFVWFYVWHNLFSDSYEEYERPSLKWILSEMVVEPIMKDERLSSINPYFPRENGGCIYPYFFDMYAGGRLILDTLDDMYKSMKIEDFMNNSYEYSKEHEEEIRRHIKVSES